MKWMLIFSFVLGTMACQVDPFAPPNAERIGYPPVPVDSLWQAMETCSNRFGDVRRIAWFHVPSYSFAYEDGRQITGMWRSEHEIYLSDNGLTNPWVVAHEMLHDLLQTGEHPAVFKTCGIG